MRTVRKSWVANVTVTVSTTRQSIQSMVKGYVIALYAICFYVSIAIFAHVAGIQLGAGGPFGSARKQSVREIGPLAEST